MVIRKLLKELSGYLEENAEFEARELFMYAADMNFTQLTLNRNKEVPTETERLVRELVKRRMAGEPLQYIIGMTEFMGLEFAVNKSTLIPRQDTELLVETIISMANEGAKIIDIGTGSGCIGISLAKYIKNSDVTVADISKAAIETSIQNAKRNSVKVKAVHLDILNDIPKGKFDIVVSNPPYIETDTIKTLDSVVRDYEPHLALDGGKDGLVFYKKITDTALKILNDGGILAYEIGYNQGGSVSKIVKDKFNNVCVIKDLCNNDRVITAIKGINNV